MLNSLRRRAGRFRRLPLPLAALLLFLLLLAACGSSTTTTTGGGRTTPTSTSMAAGMTAHATLKHSPTGSATLRWDPGTQALSVQVTLSGLAPNSSHPAHIHMGSCGQQSAIVYSLRPVVADVHGNASAQTTIQKVPRGIPSSGWYVNIHNGPGLATDEQFLPIVCGSVTNGNTSTAAAQSVTVPLTSAPPASVGESVTGSAQLALSGGTLTVKLTVSGLEPNSTHAAHIHMGSCASQGPVVYPLTTIMTNMWGSATVTTTIQNVPSIPAGGWYINIHHAPPTGLGTSTGFNPVACGDIVLG